MQMTRITVPLTQEEREILLRDAQNELRNPRDHARFLILSALGLLESGKNQSTSTVQRQPRRLRADINQPIDTAIAQRGAA